MDYLICAVYVIRHSWLAPKRYDLGKMTTDCECLGNNGHRIPFSVLLLPRSLVAPRSTRRLTKSNRGDMSGDLQIQSKPLFRWGGEVAVGAVHLGDVAIGVWDVRIRGPLRSGKYRKWWGPVRFILPMIDSGNNDSRSKM